MQTDTACEYEVGGPMIQYNCHGFTNSIHLSQLAQQIFKLAG